MLCGYYSHLGHISLRGHQRAPFLLSSLFSLSLTVNLNFFVSQCTLLICLFVSSSEPLLRMIKRGSPYSITEHRVPELIPVLGSQPAGDVNQKPDGRLPLLSARPAVTLTTLKRAATNFAAW